MHICTHTHTHYIAHRALVFPLLTLEDILARPFQCSDSGEFQLVTCTLGSSGGGGGSKVMACASVFGRTRFKQGKNFTRQCFPSDSCLLFFFPHRSQIMIKKKLQHFFWSPQRLLSPLYCLHMMLIAALFSVEKSQISCTVCIYIFIYNITFVPASMAVNRVWGGGTGAWNLHTRKNSECGDEGHSCLLPCGSQKSAPLFQPCSFATYYPFVYVCVRVRAGSCLKSQWRSVKVSVDGQSNTPPRVKGGFSGGVGEGLVVLEEGEKVVVAVGWKVGRIQVW